MGTIRLDPAAPRLLPQSDGHRQGSGRARFRFSVLTACATVALMAWGAFVTSINAGLAVPDWPTSFDSLDPFNPWPRWWTVTPILAEHGHRLLGALVGLFTLALAVWTWRSETREWLRGLTWFALALVIGQGVLGGLRVELTSLNLAVIHAVTAQVFFAVICLVALFQSASWRLDTRRMPPSPESTRLRGLATFSVVAIFLQVIFGALLRHPGTGIDRFLATTHIVWAFVVASLVVCTSYAALTHFSGHRLLRWTAWAGICLVIVQVSLGFTAYFVNLDEAGVLVPSNLQVVINTTHMVVGALITAALVCTAATSLRRVPAPSVVPKPIQGDANAHDRLAATA